MKDRYSDWYSGSGPSVLDKARVLLRYPQRTLEDLVLRDLAAAESDDERLEILTSYSLASQRQYRNRLDLGITQVGERFAGSTIKAILASYLPQPEPPYRPPRVGRVPPSNEPGNHIEEL